MEQYFSFLLTVRLREIRHQNAQYLRLHEISKTMKDLAVRAKEKKLLPEEFQVKGNH